MTTEIEVQGLVHKLEEGSWKNRVLLAVLLAAIAFLVRLWFFGDSGFKGLANPHAFEQAEIARELARGNGFTTKIIRPAAIWLFEKNTGRYPLEHTPDMYHAPLWPVILAPFIWAAQSNWVMTNKDMVYTCDKVVAGVATAFFLLAVLVYYFLAKRLFDKRLALLLMGLMLICDRFWQFSMSGLPQMLLLFLFGCACYTLLRAVEAHCALHPVESDVHEQDSESERVDVRSATAFDSPAIHAPASRFAWLGSPLPWLAATAFFFGLLALAHGLTIWIFLGALIFCGLFFPSRWKYLGMMLAIFLVMYSPWLIRNYRTCGGFGGMGGLAWYSGLYQVRGSESSIMRSMEPPLGGVGVKAFPVKCIRQIQEQMSSIFKYLGFSIVAPFFFVTLLHPFKRREIAVFRWAVLVMWLAGLLGMGFFGIDEQAFPSNDLHILFVPLMTLYGLVFILMLWSRLQVSYIRLVSISFIVMLFVLSGIPFISTFVELVGPRELLIQWPPYVAPDIINFRTWTREDEIVMSDMPWAVAWYADRASLWLPTTPENFTELSDYKRLKYPVVALYLTPVSGDKPFLAEIANGEYAKWQDIIVHKTVGKFPLHYFLPRPMYRQCTAWFDRNRWESRED